MITRPKERHLIAVKGDEEIRANLRDMADKMFCSIQMVSNAMGMDRKIMGYRIYEEYIDNYRLVEKKTGNTIAEGRTLSELSRNANMMLWEIHEIVRKGNGKLKIIKEKKFLWKR